MSSDAWDFGSDERRALGDRIEALADQGRIDRDLIAHLQADGLVHQDRIDSLREALTTARLIGSVVGIVVHA